MVKLHYLDFRRNWRFAEGDCEEMMTWQPETIQD